MKEPRVDLLTIGEAFQDLIFTGLPHMPRSGEELRTAEFVSTIGGGAVITAIAASRLGVTTAVVSALSADAAVANWSYDSDETTPAFTSASYLFCCARAFAACA